jgi:VWFA-related protein
MRAIKSVVLLAVLCSIPPAYSQFKESISVELVSVPVYVSVRNEPVRGLTRDDFELLVNGKPQEIEYFDVTEFSSPGQAGKPTSSAAVPAPAVAVPAVAVTAPPAIREIARSPLRERRLYMLVFDQALASLFERARARKAAATFVSQAAPSDFFALATFTATRGVQVLLPFTNDREVIRRALEKSSISRRDPLHLTVSEKERSSSVATSEIAAGAGNEAQSSSITDPTASLDMAAQPYYDLGVNLMDGLAQVARQMAPLDGFKHVVFLGTVVPMRSFERLDLMTLREAFQSAGVYLDTIDLAGLRPGYDVMKSIGEANMNERVFSQSLGSGSRNARANMGEGLAANPLLAEGAPTNVAVHNGPAEPSLGEISDTTGGQWIHNQNVARGLQSLSKNQQVVYTLSFRPHELGQHNTVSVRVRNYPHAVVRYRQGFSRGQANVADNPLRLADIIINDTPQHGTAAAIRTIPAPGGVRVQVVVPIRLLAAQVSATTNARVMFYVFNNTGGAVGYGQRTILLDPGSRDDAIIQHVFKLSPGHYVAKAVLRLGDSQSVGFTREPFVVEK